MDLDDAERRVELLERAMDEVERLSRAMVTGMTAHYGQPPHDGPGEGVKGGE